MTATRRLRFTTALTSAMFSFAETAWANDLPTGGQVVSGSGSIAQSASAMTITQTTHKMAIDWQSFSIGAGHSVNFVQPSNSSVALNRVLGSDVSIIQGSLTANGQIFLINPNGIVFGSGAQVNVGGLVAATQSLRTEDFLAGAYKFDGASANAIVNQGNIRAADGGTVALIAAKIVNEGTIVASAGNVLMGAGNKVTLDLGGPVKLEIDEGALETLIEQKGAVRADGGRIYLTAKAAGVLASSVINHTGITEARTLATGDKGEIVLLGDMTQGTTKVAGKLDASAPDGGDGGFIETSAAHVDIAATTTITAGAEYGRGGLWLIDPFNYTINATAASNIASTLNSGTDVTVSTTSSVSNFGGGASGNGDITVSSEISKSAGGEATLTLQAANVIVLNAEIKSTADKLNVVLDADNDSGTRNGAGVIIATKGISTNGGSLDFGTGAQLSINSSNTLVGGDVYIGGDDQVVFSTGGGAVNLYGELIIANQEGVKFNTGGGDARYYGIINSGNKYELISSGGDWTAALAHAKNGTSGGSAVGDSYLATVTSRLENAVVGYTANYQNSFLGGRRVIGIGTNKDWRWVAGPEGAMDGGNGMRFFAQNGDDTTNGTGGAAIDGAYFNWTSGEPNNFAGQPMTVDSESITEIWQTQGQWNDRPRTGYSLPRYVRETNFDTANLEIDAGNGTVTFDKNIGGLKSINYKAYDATNPNPANATTTTPTTTASVPQNSAVATAQSAAAATPTNAPTNANVTIATPPRADSFNAPTSGTGSARLTVGSMDIVQVRSGDLAPPTSGAGDAQAGGTEASGGENAQDTSPPDIVRLAQQGDLLGPTRVFVVDGGVRLPAATTDAE